jgi:hypothetical protein
MTTDLWIDGMLSGTGVRDAVGGGYVSLDAIGLSAPLAADITVWQRKYEDAHFAGFPAETVAALDREGLVLASRVRGELDGKSVGYFSNGRMERLT